MQVEGYASALAQVRCGLAQDSVVMVGTEVGGQDLSIGGSGYSADFYFLLSHHRIYPGLFPLSHPITSIFFMTDST
jgi:hypothetical protein